MIRSQSISNGIRVVMEDLPHVQSVAIGAWVKTGAVNEPKKVSGISHYIEHMLFKGTEKRNAKQIAEDVDRIGGQINAFTGKEATCYYLKTLSSNFEKGLEILSDMFLHSQFDPEELEKERNVIYEEIKMIEDSPEDLAHDLVSEAVFHGSPLARSIIGTPATLKTIGRSTIKNYLKQHYTAENLVVSVAGNFDEKQVLELIERYFADVPSAETGPVDQQAPYTPRFYTRAKDIEQSHLCLATKGVALEDERYHAFVLLNNILGGSMSSRLFQNIREEKGLAYSVYSMSSSFTGNGCYSIYAGVSHDKIGKAVRGIRDELQAIEKKGMTEDELATAREQMKAHYMFSLENVNGRMFSIGKNTLLLGRVYTLQEIIERLDRVTMDDLHQASGMICDLSRYSGALISREKKNLRRMVQG